MTAAETRQIGDVDMKNNIFDQDNPLFTVMVQADNPDRIKELIDKSLPMGAEAFGIMLEQLKRCYKSSDIYRELFSYAKGKPIYVTNSRVAENSEKTDDELAEEMLEIAECGENLLCDIIGDLFDKQPGEMTYDAEAIKKQMALIEQLHEKGANVLISSHIFKFTDSDAVLKIAKEHKRRGADVSKIVVGADNMEQQLENLKIINRLREELGSPFLFLSNGECSILRRIGGRLGCCMYLCVCEYDELATPQQPLISELELLRNEIKL